MTDRRTLRADERMMWLLRLIAGIRYRGGMTAWDEEVVDDFVEAFPEAKRALKVYTLGANSCPMLNRAAARARDRGFLSPGHVGNMDARSFNQRTWCRHWSLTDTGKTIVTPEGRSR